MDEKYVKVFIGRFQPFHLGHLKALRAAIQTSHHVVVVIGSSNAPPSLKNPWSVKERERMIYYALRPSEREKISFASQDDLPGTDQKWVMSVKFKVHKLVHLALPGVKTKDVRYTLVGCNKGADTYYLALYKGWSLDLMPQSEALNATDIRQAFFSKEKNWSKKLPGSSATYLWAWSQFRRDLFDRFCSEQYLKDRELETEV